MALMERGEPSRIPYRLAIHMVAARYGMTPQKIRNWPAQDFRDALSFLGVTSGRH